MPKFRKKPVVIEAVQWTGESWDMTWMSDDAAVSFDFVKTCGPFLYIETLEGTMTASPGDWIIKGIKGEFYPVKDEVFQATYEAVEDASR